MSDAFNSLYMQTTFGRDFPPPPPPEVEAAKPAAAPEKGSRARAQENAPGMADAGMALMDTLAGALQGAVAATIGLPGDIESLYRLIADGQQRMLTTDDVKKLLPPVVPDGDSSRTHTANTASAIGEFAPVAPVAAAKAVVKAGKRVRYDASGKRAPVEPAANKAGKEFDEIEVRQIDSKRLDRMIEQLRKEKLMRENQERADLMKPSPPVGTVKEYGVITKPQVRSVK